MKRKNFIKISIGIFSILLLLFSVLVIHIYMVTRHPNSDKRDRQLSRIDFKVKVDSLEANKIRAFVSRLEGVESTFFNVKDGILIYTYEVGKQNSENVYHKLMQSGNYQAERFIVDKEEAVNGCPVINDKKSITAHLTSYIAGIFK